MKIKNKYGYLLCDLLASLGPFTTHSVPGHSSLSKRKQNPTFQSDLLKHIPLTDLADLVCYYDIELFYLRNPQSKCDVLSVVIKFFNLKSWLEGADG
ncbi:protein of unknown function DUF3435 [Aspergillus lentulus]|nr:protein of unknown function DUF3435 [Aspergillus lentulus]